MKRVTTTACLLLSLFSPKLIEAKAPIQVFVLAGQSNMEGQGVVDLDHEEYYNGGKGTLNSVIESDKSGRYRHVIDGRSNYLKRDDVFVRFETRQGLKTGGLSIGFTGYPEKHHIGPEFQFGHVIGNEIRKPVLLIKTAWGGKSLYKDFRPPLSGGITGEYYKRMLREVDEALANIQKENLELAGRRYEISGFVWFQGWNDMYDEGARNEYAINLANLILGVREALDRPELPIVVGELGNGGSDTSDNMQSIRDAQRTATLDPRLNGNVRFVQTHQFARPADQSPNVGHAHHWFGNAESYFLIGDAFGKAMLDLLKR